MTKRIKNKEIADTLYDYGAFYLEGSFSTGPLKRLNAYEFNELITSMNDCICIIDTIYKLARILDNAKYWSTINHSCADVDVDELVGNGTILAIESLIKSGRTALEITPDEISMLDSIIQRNKQYHKKQKRSGGEQ